MGAFHFPRDVNGYIFILAYVSRLKSHNAPLKLLVENELYRLSVWANPMNDSKRGMDYSTNLERSITDVRFFIAFLRHGITGYVIGGLEECYTSSMGD